MRYWFLALAFLLTTVHSFSKDIYVDVSDSRASDGNSGASSAPLKTIKKAISLAVAGDTIWVKDGIYREHDLLIKTNGSAGSPLRLKAAGSKVIIRGTQVVGNSDFRRVSGYQFVYSKPFSAFAVGRVVETDFANWKPVPVEDPTNGAKFSFEKPIPYTSVTSIADVEKVPGSYHHNGSTLYVHTFDNGDPSTGRHAIEVGQTLDGYLRVDGNYVFIDGFKFQFARAVLMNGSHNSRLENCELLAVPLTVQLADNAVVDSVLIENVAFRGPTFEWHTKGTGRGLSVLQGTKNIIRNVTVKRGWNGATVKGKVGVRTDHLVEDMVVWGFPNHALEAENLDRATFRRISISNAQDSLQITASSNLDFSNSVVFESVIVQYSCTNISFRNMILFSRYLVASDSVIGFSSDYNLFLRGSKIYKFGDAYYDTLQQVRSNILQEKNSLQLSDSTGQFLNFVGRTFEANDYSLVSGSVAIDAGCPTFPVPPDGGSRIDIGCFEFVIGGAPAPPGNLRLLSTTN
jgi:hypothetical protein